MARRILICVGEMSGDQHAANLVRELRALDGEVIVDALGGPALRQAGAVIRHDTVSRAAMGLAALGRWREVLLLEKWVREYVAATRPDLVICVDSWEMNKRFARIAHAGGVKVMYYIAPQVWASREGRVGKMRQWVDRVACIHRFEEDYLTRRGIAATYVGHPLFDHVRPVPRRPAEQRYPNRPAIIALVAGSRQSVAGANFPRLLEVARRMKSQMNDLKFQIPTTAATDGVVREILASRAMADDSDFLVALDGFDGVLPECDLCLTVSGTATLHAAAFGVPMIAVYYGNPILWQLIGRWIVKTRRYVVVNILAGDGEMIVPEFIPWYGSVEPVAQAALDLLNDPVRREGMSRRLTNLVATIGQPGASKRAAGVAMELMT